MKNSLFAAKEKNLQKKVRIKRHFGLTTMAALMVSAMLLGGCGAATDTASAAQEIVMEEEAEPAEEEISRESEQEETEETNESSESAESDEASDKA